MTNLVITASRLLVVEGKDEDLLFAALMKDMGLTNLQILPIGGKDRLRQQLKALVNAPKFTQIVTHIGIIRDSDLDPTAAFQSVCSSLAAAGLSAPNSACTLCPGTPNVAVMVHPQNLPGALEDICLESVRADPAMECIEKFFQCLDERGIQPKTPSKAKIQVFLASRDEPGKRLGEAAWAGYWPWHEDSFSATKQFLQLIAS